MNLLSEVAPGLPFLPFAVFLVVAVVPVAATVVCASVGPSPIKTICSS
jgi:hypothetical protein